MTDGSRPTDAAEGAAPCMAGGTHVGSSVATALGRARSALLRQLHEQFVDRRYHRFEAVPTGGMIELDALEIRSGNTVHATHLAPTPRLVLCWIHKALPRGTPPPLPTPSRSRLRTAPSSISSSIPSASP